MKEFKSNLNKPIIDTHYPLPKRSQFRKAWINAQSRENFDMQTGTNNCTEEAFHRIIETVKQNHLKPGERYFDRDFKTDKSENCCAMHSLLTPSFYIFLECSIDFEYRVSYEFNNCSFEAEIRMMLQPFPLDRVSREVALQPSFKSFYDGVMRVQDKRFIFPLLIRSNQGNPI